MNKITRSAWSRLKRGFTLVELVIVIAVIAVLAAVLVPTFITVIDNANNSADLQLTASANTILSTDLSADSTATVENLRKLLKDNGITDLTTKQKDNVILYNKEAKKFELKKLNDKTAIGVKDPEASAGTAKTVAADNGDLQIDFAAYCPEEIFAGYIIISTGGNPLSEGLYKLHNWESKEAVESNKNILKNITNSNIRTALGRIIPQTLYVDKNGEMFRINADNDVLTATDEASKPVDRVVFHEECTTIKLSDLANNLKETESLIVTLPETLESVTTNASAGSLAGVTLAGNTDIVKLPENDASGVGVSNKSVSELKDLLNDEDNLKLAYQNEFYVSATQTGDYYYSDLQAALNIANKSADLLGTTAYKNVILVDKTYSVDSDITIPQNVSLLLPYNGNAFVPNEYETSYKVNYEKGINSTAGATSKSTFGVEANRKVELVVGNEVTITNYGKIRIGGVTSGQQVYAGGTAGDYAQITLGSNAKIDSYGDIDAYGFIAESTKDNNSQVIMNEGTLRMTFRVIEHRGGSAFTAIYYGWNSKAGDGSPFNRYYMENCTTLLTLKSSAFLLGYANLFASSQDNTTDIKLWGNTNEYMMQSMTDSYFTMKFNHDDLIAQINIYGDMKLNSLSLTVTGLKLTMDKTYFPFTYHQQITLNPLEGQEATVDCSAQDLKLFPGAKVEIKKGVTVKAKKIVVYDKTYVDPNTYGSVDAWKYPTNGRDGLLIVGGTLEAQGIGGAVLGSGNGAKLTVSDLAEITTYEVETVKALSIFSSCTWKSFTNTLKGGVYNESGEYNLSPLSVNSYTFNGTTWEATA